MILITFGQEVSFRFTWRISINSESPKKKLALIAQDAIDSNHGMSLTLPREQNLDPAAYEVMTLNTPDVPMEFNNNPLRQIYVYDTMGSGKGWKYLKAVDLRTGSIWTVKESRDNKKEVVREMESRLETRS